MSVIDDVKIALARLSADDVSDEEIEAIDDFSREFIGHALTVTLKLARDQKATIASITIQRDEALAILRELVRDSADSGCVSVAMGRARKLLGDI